MVKVFISVRMLSIDIFTAEMRAPTNAPKVGPMQPQWACLASTSKPTTLSSSHALFQTGDDSMRTNFVAIITAAIVCLISFAATADEPTRMIAGPIAAQMPDESDIVIETIIERYNSGKTKVERQVAMDIDLNYVNHGDYRMFDQNGEEIAHGMFQADLREGPWVRIFSGKESTLFTQAPYKNFQAPFTSEATFRGGMMEGAWIIKDSLDRKVSEVQLINGQRDGKLVFYNTSGDIAREIEFRGGVVDGTDRSYNGQGEIASEQRYIDGRRIVTKSDTYISTKKKTEGTFLHPRMTVVALDDFWNAKLATFGTEEGEAVRHGAYNSWHVNGQLRTTGEYALGKPVGEFTWWHANGQVAIRGAFVDGLHHGNWQWWHPNGMRSAKGQYNHGIRVGQWMQWEEDGALADAKNHGGDVEEVAGVNEESEDGTSRRPRRLPENESAATPTLDIAR